jgi:hypothetical protein
MLFRGVPEPKNRSKCTWNRSKVKNKSRFVISVQFCIGVRKKSEAIVKNEKNWPVDIGFWSLKGPYRSKLKRYDTIMYIFWISVKFSIESLYKAVKIRKSIFWSYSEYFSLWTLFWAVCRGSFGSWSRFVYYLRLLCTSIRRVLSEKVSLSINGWTEKKY